MDILPHHQFGIIGTGRVASALGLGLAAHSIGPVLLWGRNPDHADVAAARMGGSVTPNVGALVENCDAIGIAVSDDALRDIAADLAAALPANRASFIFHVSGRSGAGILEPLRTAGALTAAIHPAMTFTGDPHGEVRRMAGARFAITGSTAEATERARRIVALLAGIPVEVAEDHRALYHAALCHASNHLVTLIAGAANTLRNAGVDDPAGLLAPLVRAALENSLDKGFAGLSGPLLRGDVQTIGDHLDAIKDHSPDLLPAYRAMARATVDELKRGEITSSTRLTALDSLLAVP